MTVAENLKNNGDFGSLSIYNIVNFLRIGGIWWENVERVIIYTAKKAMAGTDANVGISLWDEERSLNAFQFLEVKNDQCCGERWLTLEWKNKTKDGNRASTTIDSDGKIFESGCVDEFT